MVGAPDADRGEIVKAFVVLRHGFDPTADLIGELQEHVKNVTAPSASTRGRSRSSTSCRRPRAARSCARSCAGRGRPGTRSRAPS